jgi:hypothetical protein
VSFYSAANIVVYIDGITSGTFTYDNTGNWNEALVNIQSGTHTIKWVFNPQNCYNGTTGYGYIDEVCFPH